MSNPTITLTDAFCYLVNNNGEHGSFFIQHGDTDEENGGWVSMTANTDFGVVGYRWNAIGDMPWQAFLAKLSKHYLLKKLYGEKAEEFDPEGTLAAIREWAHSEDCKRNWRVADVLQAADDVEAEGLAPTLHEFISHFDSAMGSDEPDFIEALAKERTSSEAEGFWRDLWPAFASALQEEMAGRERGAENPGSSAERMRG